MENREVKSCVVEGCGANSQHCPYLFFLKVPQNPERRILWCDAMGVPLRKTRLYCCTRHFDIPGDFDGDSAAADKSSGVRLKLKCDVLPHRGIPYQEEVRNIYAIFNKVLKDGRIEPTHKYLLPAIEHDLKIKVPLNIQSAVLNKMRQFLVDSILSYFNTNLDKSRYQLVQHLKSAREQIIEIANEKIVIGTVQSFVALKTIQPFLQYDAYGCLNLPVNSKQLELMYFECESNQLKAYCRPSKRDSLPTASESSDIAGLFFTPGIRVRLNLPFLELEREVVSNSEKYIVDKKSTLKATEIKPNGLENFQKIDKPYRLKSSKIGQNVSLEYLEILINLFGTYAFMLSQWQRSALIYLLQQIKKEFSDYEMKELNVTYGFLQSKYKYFRIINEDLKSHDDGSYLYVKEVINPEINFHFINALDNEAGAIDRIEQYFRPILGYVAGDSGYNDGEPYLKFADQLKKAIIYSCQECNATFDSALSHLTILEHRFCGTKKWKCSNCRQQFEETEIAANSWQHRCSSLL